MRLTPTEPKIPKDVGFTDENDIFEYHKFGERLINLVSNINEPLVIALDAPWGSGKSVFIKQWAGLIRERGGSVVYFDAFSNDFHDDAFLALASEIHFLAKDTLDEGDSSTATFLDKAKKVGRAFAPISLRLAAHIGTFGFLSSEYIKAGEESIEAIAKALGNETEKILENTISEKLQKTREEHALLEDFREALESVSKAITEKKKNTNQRLPLIFIVDELDRCRPPFALDVIERMKHLFSVPNVCFVLVTHLPQLETIVRGAYGTDLDSYTYLEKFYHLKVVIPELNNKNQKQRNKYLHHLWKNLNPKFESASVAELVFDEIRCLVNTYELSLRKIERALTNVVLAAATASENQLFVPPVVAGLCIMRQTHPDLYARARENNLTWHEVENFLKIDSNIDENNNLAISREWALGFWQYFVDPNAPQEIIDQYSGLHTRYNLFYNRLSLLQIFTDYIDNLPSPSTHDD